MATHRLRSLWLIGTPILALTIALLPAAVASGTADDDLKLPPALEKPMPENVKDLQSIEAHVKLVVAKVMPAVVNIKAGGQGSGVVISEDGYVLTAAHVTPTPNQTITLTFPDGKKVKAKALGSNGKADDGLVKIIDEGKYPFCEMGKSGELKKMQWCITIGHPGGWKDGRTPPVRLGRVIAGANGQGFIQTECTLVGGDSGGPLFDMQGRVIGIHSRIGNSLTQNMHVPVDIYREDWERMIKGERWGGQAPKGGGGPQAGPARLGVEADPEFKGKGVKIIAVVVDAPAAKAGVKPGDIITMIDAKAVSVFEELRVEIANHKVGDEITLEVRRGTEMLKLKAVLDRALPQ